MGKVRICEGGGKHGEWRKINNGKGEITPSSYIGEK